MIFYGILAAKVQLFNFFEENVTFLKFFVHISKNYKNRSIILQRSLLSKLNS